MFVRIIIPLIFVTTLFACKKYEQGPSLSLIPKKERIANKWAIENVTVGSADSTEKFRNYIFEFTDKGSVILQIGPKKYTGTWQLNNNKEDFDIFYDTDDHVASSNKILKMENDQFWFRNKLNNLEFHLKPH